MATPVRAWVVTHWVGWVPEAPPASTPSYDRPETYDCKSIAFIAARGSGEDPQGDPEPVFSGADDGVGYRVGDVLAGLRIELGDYGAPGAASDVKVLGVQYRALGVGNNASEAVLW